MKKFFFLFFFFVSIQADAKELKLIAVFGSDLDPLLIKIGDVSQNSKIILKELAQDYIEERQQKLAFGYYQINSQNWLEKIANKEINLVFTCNEVPMKILQQNKLIQENIFSRNSQKCYIVYEQKPRTVLFGFISYIKTVRAQNIAVNFSQMP